MKFVPLVIALLAATALPAFAAQCQDEVKKVETALASANVPSDQRAQIEDMKKQAAELCKAGNEQESLDVSAEAKELLNID